MAAKPKQSKLAKEVARANNAGPKSSNACIKSIIAASSRGDITEKQAAALIKTIADRAKERAKLKSISYEQAVNNITGELSGASKFNAAGKRRNLLLSYLRARDAISSLFRDTAPGESRAASKKRTVKDRLFDLLDSSYRAGLAIGKRFVSRLEADIGDAMIWKESRSGVHDRATWNELFEMGKENRKGFVTKNRAAQTIAEAWYNLKSKEVNPKANRSGAFTENKQGWGVRQTTDSNFIRSLADVDDFTIEVREGGVSVKILKRTKRHGIDAKTNSMKVYYRMMDEAGINVDWDRSLDGTPKDVFMRHYHNNHFNSSYSTPADSLNPNSFQTHGSLATQMSSERQLWFADGDSAWKYNQIMGLKKTLHESMLNDLESTGKQIGVLQSLGPNPKQNLEIIRQRAIDMINNPDRVDNYIKNPDEREAIKAKIDDMDTAEAIKDIKSKAIDNAYAVLSGEVNQTTRPFWARTVDNIKQMEVLSKLGGAVITSISDKAFLNNALARHGFTLMDQFTAQILTHTPKGVDRKAYLSELGYTADALSHNIAGRWMTDFNAWKTLKKLSDLQFKASGMNAWVRIHEQTAAEMFGFKLGQESGVAFKDLSDTRKRDFFDFDITEAEWNAIRKNPTKGYNDANILTMESGKMLPDAEVDGILKSQGKKLTKHNRAMARDMLEHKFGALFDMFVTEAVPKPGLKERAMVTQGLTRGEPLRNFNELFFLFKSFPISVFNMLKKQLGKSNEGLMAKKWLGSMILQTTIAGYISMTVKDYLAGKTPRKWFDDDGNLNGSTLMESILRGGGAGIWGDVLFQEYSQFMRTPMASIAGPALGDASTATFIASDFTRNLVGMDGAETRAYQAARLVEQSMPFANLWYIKPFMQNMFWLNVRESLSPGVFSRMESAQSKRGVQEYFHRPSDSGDIGEMLENYTEGLIETPGNLTEAVLP